MWRCGTRAAKHAELEAQLAEAQREREIERAMTEQFSGLAGKLQETVDVLCEGKSKAEAEARRLREVLQKVEAWFVGEGGPIEYRWENGDIGDFEEVVWDWDEVLEWIRDLKTPLGPDENYPSIVLYREIYAALTPEVRECPMCDGTEQQHMGDCLLGLVDRESEEG